MGYLVPPPPPRHRPVRLGHFTNAEIRMLEGDPIKLPLRQGLAKVPPPYPATEGLLPGYPPDRSASGLIPSRPGQSFDPSPGWLRAVGAALVALLPSPTLPAPLTEDHREDWPNLYRDRA